LMLMHSIMLDQGRYYRSQQILAQKIKERYNRMNPGKRAAGIRLFMINWPASRKSYEELRIARLIQVRLLYEDFIGPGQKNGPY
jgi:hypothetical protein